MRVSILVGTVALAMTCGSLCAAPVDHTEQANCQMELDPSKACRFSTGEAKYEIDRQGRLLRSMTGANDKAVNLPFDGLVLDTVLYIPYERDLILLCEVEDGEGAWGLIFRLDHMLEIKWRMTFPAFNLSVGALEDRFLYQAGLGTVAKVDLERGVFAWKHEHLYDPKLQSFNSFGTPDVGPDDIIFQEKLVPKLKGPARSIRVNKLSGKLQVE
jgi:hypothetical protein